MIAALAAKFWRELLIVSLVLVSWQWIGCVNKQKDKAIERSVVLEQLFQQVKEVNKDMAASISSQNEAIKTWKAAAEAQKVASAKADAEVKRIHDRLIAEQRARAADVAKLMAELEAVPQDDQCEVAAAWLRDWYRKEVIHAK